MWYIKVVYAGAAFYMVSITEPEWRKVKTRQGIRRKLILTIPEQFEENQKSHKDQPGKPIYYEDLSNFHWDFREVIEKPKPKEPTEMEEGELLKGLDEDSDTYDVFAYLCDREKSGQKVWYSVIKGEIKEAGVSVNQLGSSLRWLHENGYISRTKKGQRSYFRPTKVGMTWWEGDR